MDDLEVLKVLYPVSDLPEDLVVHQQREKLMSFIENNPSNNDQAIAETARSSKRRKVAALVAVPVAAALLAAAGWSVFQSDASEASSFSCETDDVQAALPNFGGSPLEECATLWQSGGMVPGVTTAPSLVACLDGRSSVVVIEGANQSVCESRGMVAWKDQPEYEAAGQSVRKVLESLHDRYNETGNGCATVADWRSGLADQPGTQGWTVKVDQVDPSFTCYWPSSVDPTSRTVTILGQPGDFSISCDPRKGC